jgi:hypothetical protein
MKIQEFHAQMQTSQRAHRLTEALRSLKAVDVGELRDGESASSLWDRWNMDFSSWGEAPSQSVVGDREMATSTVG